MKKLLCLLLACLMLLPLASCGKEPASSTETDTAVASSAQKTDSAVSTKTDTPATDSQVITETATVTDPVTREEHHYVGIGDQGHNRICIYDLDVGDLNDPKALIWEYTNCYSSGLKFRHSDYYDTDVLIWCGGSIAEMVDLKTKKVLYHTDLAGNNTHSEELLPDGTLLVTATTGKTVKAFDTKNPKADYPQWTYDLGYDGHGCLYDPDTEMVWIAGSDHIIGYLVTSTGLKKLGGCTIKMPKSGVHDLAPIYGMNGYVWVTCSDGVIKVDLNEGTVSKNYPKQINVGSANYTPGFGNWKDGSYVWVVPDGTADGWTTSVINYFPVNESLKYTKVEKQASTYDRYYKCRVFCTDYQ